MARFTKILSNSKSAEKSKLNSKAIFKRMVAQASLENLSSSESEEELPSISNRFNKNLETISLSPSPLGLLNNRNTCFFNSVIQCLFSLSPLRDYFIEATDEDNILKKIFLKLMISKAPILLNDYLRDISLTDFSLGQQYDAQECLVQLLEKCYPLNMQSIFAY